MSQPYIKFPSRGSRHQSQDHRREPAALNPCRRLGSVYWDGPSGGFLVHPMATDHQVRVRMAPGRSRSQNVAAERPVQTVAVTASQKPSNDGHATEERLAQAARQLHDQTKESEIIFQTFYDKFNEDIGSIRNYVDAATRRRIWQSKVEQNAKYSEGKKNEDQQLAYQLNKLKVCFHRFNDFAKNITVGHGTTDADVHDSRGFQLEKICATYDRVSRLARKSLVDDGACRDLITELRELLNMVDPAQSTAEAIYRFDKREIKPGPAAKEAEQIDGTGGHAQGEADQDNNWDGQAAQNWSPT